MTTIEDRLWSVADDLRGISSTWGGGGITGPTEGIPADPATPHTGDHTRPGFDAGSLAQFVLFKVFGIELPRTTFDQQLLGREVDAPEAGDLIYPDGEAGNYNMVYLGRGHVIETGPIGGTIRVSPSPTAGFTVRRVVEA